MILVKIQISLIMPPVSSDHSGGMVELAPGGILFVSEETQITVPVRSTERVVKLTRGHVSFASSIGQELKANPVPESIIRQLDGFACALETIRELLPPNGDVSGEAIVRFREVVAHVTTICEAIPPEYKGRSMHFQIEDLRVLTSRESMRMVAFRAALINLAVRLKGVVTTMRDD